MNTAPHLVLLADKALKLAVTRAGDEGRMVKYEIARQITGLGKTQLLPCLTYLKNIE